MALLTENQRIAAWTEMMRTMSAERNPCLVTKADLRAAFDAIDNFFETNINAINNAFPEPAKTNLTARQKAMILAIVIRVRFNVGA